MRFLTKTVDGHVERLEPCEDNQEVYNTLISWFTKDNLPSTKRYVWAEEFEQFARDNLTFINTNNHSYVYQIIEVDNVYFG